MAVFIFITLITCCNTAPVQDEITTGSSDNGIEPIQIQTIPAVRKPYTYKIKAIGTAVASKQADIVFKQNGMIDKIFIKNAKSVTKGTRLAALEDSQLQLEYEKARANLKNKEYEFESLMLSYQSEDLSDSRGKKIVESIEYSSGLADAKITFREAQNRLATATLLAPFSGIITDLEIGENNYVNQNQLFCKIYAPSSIIIETTVLQSEGIRLSKGDEASVILPGINYNIVAEVIEINPKVDENGLMKVKLKPAKTSHLLPGMKVNLTINIPAKQDAIVVPKDAVVIRSGREVIFTALNGVAKWNYVIIGEDNGDEVEVIEGLNEGDQVIVTGNLQLAHDAPVVVE